MGKVHLKFGLSFLTSSLQEFADIFYFLDNFSGYRKVVEVAIIVETILTLVCVLCPCLAFIIDCIAPASLLEGPLRFVPMLYVLFQSFMDTVNSRFSEDSLTLR